jgi:hypothetical protein
MPTRPHGHTVTRSHGHTVTHSHANTLTCPHAHTLTRPHTHTRQHTHMSTHPHANTLTHLHTHTPKLASPHTIHYTHCTHTQTSFRRKRTHNLHGEAYLLGWRVEGQAKWTDGPPEAVHPLGLARPPSPPSPPLCSPLLSPARLGTPQAASSDQPGPAEGVLPSSQWTECFPCQHANISAGQDREQQMGVGSCINKCVRAPML